MKTSLALLALAFVTIAKAQQLNGVDFVKTYLPGRWQEDQYQRENLNNFLYEMGFNWFKRVFVTQSSWENQQNITFDGRETWDIRGRKGPRSEKFNFNLVMNNNTRTNID